ncbi:E3 ubiquitin-protein ligase RNF26 [Limanda limanda]|uniref:E3 ubiquitin-protein ligase RNF26 n=1 Tax=Limanda limanda TaxID=27771 RepID=UPI0029C7076A|nr:E3 ubiquitin-protein ligase RNF26 [Limanda limanda]
MGLVNFVLSTVGKCLDAVCLLLDLNFLVVHTVVRTLLAVVTFITSLPTLLLTSVLELANFLVFCLVSAAEATTTVAQGTVTMLGGLLLALEGLLESLKMVGYLSMHVLLRGKEHLCRGVLSMLEGCGIAVSLVVYFTNTVVNYALIATQNVYMAVAGVWHTVSSPLLKVLELTLTSLTFLYSSLAGTSAFLWSPCQLLLDFLVSLVHIFISIFILNIYGLVLTATIALTTTVYLNPQLTRQAAAQTVDYVNSFHGVHRLASAAQGLPHLLRGNMRRLRRILHHLYLLETRLMEHLSRHFSQIGRALDGNPQEERRGPPDGRAGDGAHQEMQDLVFPSSSTDRPLKKVSSPDRGGKPLPEDNLLTLLKEQEDRKKCVICQDCTKTVVLLPCRHLCLCRECTDIVLRQPVWQQKCPLCRRFIFKTMDVYL